MVTIKVDTVSPAPLNPPEIAKAEAWKGWIKAMIFIILTDSWITEGSSVYRLVILGPKKKNNNPKIMDDISANLLDSLIKI